MIRVKLGNRYSLGIEDLCLEVTYRCTKMGLSVHIFVFLLGCLGCVSGLPRRLFYSYGTVQGDKEIQRADDVSSPEIQLQTPIYFYDGMYTSVFVSIQGDSFQMCCWRLRKPQGNFHTG